MKWMIDLILKRTVTFNTFVSSFDFSLKDKLKVMVLLYADYLLSILELIVYTECHFYIFIFNDLNSVTHH